MLSRGQRTNSPQKLIEKTKFLAWVNRLIEAPQLHGYTGKNTINGEMWHLYIHIYYIYGNVCKNLLALKIHQAEMRCFIGEQVMQ